MDSVAPSWQTADGSVQLYLGDWREIGVRAADVDVVITDPPYGMAHPCDYASRGRDHLAQCNNWDDVAGDGEPFDPSQILALGVPTVLWGGNWFADKLPASSGWLVWDKQRPDDLDQATCELAWTNCIKGVRRFTHLWHGMMRASEKGDAYHPTQKPVALFDWILDLRWIPNGVVFDPYMGSGPCGVACAKRGRPYVGCEINPVYFFTAVKRIEAELNRAPLFEEPVQVQRQLEGVA